VNHSHSATGRHAGRLAAAIGVGALVLVIELAAGIIGNSLALLADAGHVFADVSGMGLSLAAVWVAARPPTGRRSFGLYRLEIVAATANAILLQAIALVVFLEAIQRFTSPPAVRASRSPWV
jgi:cobalt-zinc-cadmium efflux system protein